jgi:hypothetical protein
MWQPQEGEDVGDKVLGSSIPGDKWAWQLVIIAHLLHI